MIETKNPDQNQLSCSLNGITVINLGINLPGPLAASRFARMGAQVIKVEPPGGDPFARICPVWYKTLLRDQKVIQLDLKDRLQRAQLDELLGGCDLLITASRPAALERLGLAWPALHAQYPRLCQVAMFGYPAPGEDRPGHDLLYQASAGLVTPPNLPLTLLADVAGAERVVTGGLALLLSRQRGNGGAYARVSLFEAAEVFALPSRYGLTNRGGLLGGGFPGYNLYQTKQGWIAVAALEAHFWERLVAEMGLDMLEIQRQSLADLFLDQTAEYWEAWASQLDLPIIKVRGHARNPFYDDA
ncbi:MAG TPA: CoA transferase [Anaerolineales bacterium]|jgi:crotonobetainyl-CoA:carnitine CoA-transferase CaiB-like acyl-CoA transferase|nr:CoA transferase [Anaerolineales bacterium]